MLQGHTAVTGNLSSRTPGSVLQSCFFPSCWSPAYPATKGCFFSSVRLCSPLLLNFISFLFAHFSNLVGSVGMAPQPPGLFTAPPSFVSSADWGGALGPIIQVTNGDVKQFRSTFFYPLRQKKCEVNFLHNCLQYFFSPPMFISFTLSWF